MTSQYWRGKYTIGIVMSIFNLGGKKRSHSILTSTELPQTVPLPSVATSVESAAFNQQFGASFRPGDIIGQKYKVIKVLGIGGFGVVYLVNSRYTQDFFALKTFRDDLLANPTIRQRFRKEANVWVNLDRHPYIVRAYSVEEFGNQLYVALEFIPPNEQGLNSLQGYIDHQKPHLHQCLRWAIQFCYGMEYAYSKGVQCHRDIKPDNIMIGQDGILKVSDFGIAGVSDEVKFNYGSVFSSQEGGTAITPNMTRGMLGTPYYMPPEQFLDAASADQKSDIYSFGIVLYQMVTGGDFPFFVQPPRDVSEEEQIRFLTELFKAHSEVELPRLNSPLEPVIKKCLEKRSDRRYQNFSDLRYDLASHLKSQTGEKIKTPNVKVNTASEWADKGASLAYLARYEEAIICSGKALMLDPQLPLAWNNKGNCLFKLGRIQEAVTCYEKAVEIKPDIVHAWNNMGMILRQLGFFDEAIVCYTKALKFSPGFAIAWNNMGACLQYLNKNHEALRCFDVAIQSDPYLTGAWLNKGASLESLNQIEEAINAYKSALKLDPQQHLVWHHLGICFDSLGQPAEAVECFRHALAIDQAFADSWFKKGFAEERIGRKEDAKKSFQNFVNLASQQDAAKKQYANQRLRLLSG